MTKLQTGPVALYGQLASILRDKVRSGVWPDGYEIPTLEDMTAEYSLARVTVRQAVQSLVREGLLSSHRGRRTYVTYPLAEQNTVPLFTSVDVISPHSPEYAVRVHSVDFVHADNIAPAFQGHFVGEYARLRKTDYESGLPYSTSVHHIQKALYDRFPSNAAASAKVVRLVRDYGGEDFTSCLERIGVKAASVDESIELRCAAGSPLGTTHRVFLNSTGEILYEGRLSYDGMRFGIERDISAVVRG